MIEAKIPHALTSVARTILEQMALFVQGRLPLDLVNSFRLHAGLYTIAKEDNNVVTWTLDSKHVTNFFDKDLNNDKSRAFDFVILKEGQMTWDIKVNVNENEIPDYEEAGRIGESVGLVYGGRFSTPDRCHLQVAL